MPEDRDSRPAFLEGWAVEQQRRLDAEEIARVLAGARQRLGRVDSFGGQAVIPVVITKPSDLPVDRAAVFADLIVGLRKCRWADPIVSECEETRYIAPNAIELARGRGPGAPWLLYMEDDVILGPDFALLPGLLREAEGLFPNAGVVSFFSGTFVEPGWSSRPIGQFGWLQCIAIRNTDYLEGFRAFIDSGLTRKEPYDFPDLAVRAFLAVEYDAFALWCPSLVQHADVTSAFFSQATSLPNRVSKSYQQAYG